MKKIIVGSRGSELARTQSKWVIEQLKPHAPETEFEVRVIKTSGDNMITAPFTQMVGKGFFTKEIEEALIDKEIDFAVHSLKDLPSDSPEGLVVGATPKREDPRDVLVSESGKKLSDLPKNAIVGTSSPRRQAWIRAFRDDLNIVPIRGNINTRLKKVFGSEEIDPKDKVDAAIFAFAGLNRIGLGGRVTEVLEPNLFLPAPGQGVLAVQCRKEDDLLLMLLAKINDTETAIQATAERAFLAAWGGGCSVPLGAYAELKDGEVKLEAAVFLEEENRLVREKSKASFEEAFLMGEALAKELKTK